VIGIIGIILLIGIVRRRNHAGRLRIRRARRHVRRPPSAGPACSGSAIMMTTWRAARRPAADARHAPDRSCGNLGLRMVGGLTMSQLLTLFTTRSSTLISTPADMAQRSSAQDEEDQPQEQEEKSAVAAE